MSVKKLSSLAAIVCGVLCAGQIEAQNQTGAARQNPSPASAQTSARSADDADLAITGSVTARELRFDVVPNPTVEFTGRPQRDTVWEAERENLPRPVQPGVTYRDIGVRLRITSVFSTLR